MAPIDTSRIAQNKQPCDLKGLVDTALASLQGTASRQSIRIHFEFPADGCQMLGDEGSLHRLIMLLVKNGIVRSLGGSEVTIALTRGTTGIQLRVRDQGSNISKDRLQHVFEPLRGLALPAVKAIAQAHGGTFEARNLPEGGVEFAVLLPASMALPPEA